MNGNRLSDHQFNYQWDEGDRLISVTKRGDSQPFTSYTYDDDNRRLSKTVNGEVTHYHYDGDSINVLYETDKQGTVLRHYIYSDDSIRLAMKSGQETLYYHYNSHGDVIALTDDSGKQVASYVYDAWGNVLSSNETTALAKTNPYGYAGYTYDKEIKQYYLMARYYHPEHGVFTSIDPHPGKEDDPITMNGYTYCDNNPVMKVDPDGHFAITAGVGIYYGLYAVGVFGAAAYSTYRVRSRRKSFSYRPTRTRSRRINFSKGGKQRVGDTGLRGLSTDEIKKNYKQSKGKAKKRYEKELKNRGEKNKRKRRK